MVESTKRGALYRMDDDQVIQHADEQIRMDRDRPPPGDFVTDVYEEEKKRKKDRAACIALYALVGMVILSFLLLFLVGSGFVRLSPATETMVASPIPVAATCFGVYILKPWFGNNKTNHG